MGKSVRQERKTRPGSRGVIVLSLAAVLCGLVHGAEPGSRESSRLQSLRLDGYFDPKSNFLDATARLSFDGPAGDKCLWLAEELQLHSVRGGTTVDQPFTREPGLFLVRSPGESELELNYSGRLALRKDPLAAPEKDESKGMAGRTDDCRFLSYIADYYPHPQLDFTPIEMNMRLPSGWNCLGSGSLRSVQPQEAGNTFSFANPEAKGMALVCGRFQQVDLLPGQIPVRLHAWPGFDYQRYVSAAGTSKLLSFYAERFGPLAVPELNILLRRGSNFGGISYSGLIVLNIDESWALLSPRIRHRLQAESLLALDDSVSDLLAHEVAHQWWGGIISWQTAADNWLTEGLATYSSLIFLREHRGEKAYAKACQRFRRSVKKYANRGVPADGYVLKMRHRNIKVYQALVYLKPALMLAELAGQIGEDELCRRLREILTTQRCRNLGTAEFLGLLSAGDEALQSRLTGWICGSGLPKGL